MTTGQAIAATQPPREASGTRSESSVGVLEFLLVVLQCAVIYGLIERFQVENHLFRITTAIALGGFLVHHFLPMRARLPFFAALSAGVIVYGLGLNQGRWEAMVSLQRTGTLGVIGLGLIGICHLPLAFQWRVVLLLGAGGALAVYRAGVVRFAMLEEIWPVLGAMFMFRLMAYLYDLDTQKERPGAVRTLAYFFLFPNLWLYVAPVIDFRQFTKSYYNARPLAIYQKGLHWMMRGIIHLLIWRLFYYQVYLDPAKIATGTELAQYLLANIALYLRVIGQFHFVIGLLHLFGFNLPETNRRVFLASSFTDYWRRVNIYWKDFVLKVFYYPSIVRLKSWGPVGSVIGATTIAFFLTWFLHSYQWFWLRGAFPLTAKEMVFWGSLGVLVCVNTLVEMRRGRERTLGTRVLTWTGAARRAAATGGTFATISLLWSIWTCDSLGQWVDIWRVADRYTLLWCVAGVGLMMICAVIEYFSWDDPFGLAAKPAKSAGQAAPPLAHVLRQTAVYCLAPAACFYFISSYRVMAHYPPALKEAVRSLSQASPNKSDEEYMVRGYYENLMDGSRFNNLVSESFKTRPASWIRLDQTDAARDIADLRLYELVPLKTVVINGKTISINQWGMRDKDYEVAKEPGVCRIAIFGSSHEMGYGVHDPEVFEALLEEQLNRLHAGKTWKRFEILNFSGGAYSSLSLVDVLYKKALSFRPDVLLFFSHEGDTRMTIRQLALAVSKGIDPQYGFVREVIRKAGVTPSTARPRIEQRLTPYSMPLMEWSYRELVAASRRTGIQPAWVLVPSSLHMGISEESRNLARLAEQTDFQVVNLIDAFAGRDLAGIIVAPWDSHYNATGHQLIADALYRESFKIEALRLGAPPAQSQPRP